MKLNHYREGSTAAPARVIDDFGTEHNLTTGEGDFGDVSGATFDRAGQFMYSQMQVPEAFANLWGVTA